MKTSIVCGDITQFEGDAIVNAANSELLGGGGVDGAIHRAAGPELRFYCEKVRPMTGIGLGPGGVPMTEGIRCAVGAIVPTPGFNLKAPWIFHTVAPRWNPQEMKVQAHLVGLAGAQMKVGATLPEDQLRQMMRDIYKKALLLAMAMGLKHVAFPALGCGVYGWSHEDLSEVAMRFAWDYADWPINVSFYLFPADSFPIWEAAAKKFRQGV